MYSLILLSGGVGKRMQNSIPKQYMLLAGKPVIMHSLEKIDQIAEVDEIIVVCAEEYRSTIQMMLEQYGIKKRVSFATAGNTRQASVKSGLALVKTPNVIIHEAARPFVKIEDYQKLIAEKSENAIFGLDIPFTVVIGHKYIEKQLDRSELVNVQLPQKFNTELLLQAHNFAEKEGKIFTEDASMLFNYFPQTKVEICAGLEYNIKLTTRTDMLVGERIYDEIFVRRK